MEFLCLFVFFVALIPGLNEVYGKARGPNRGGFDVFESGVFGCCTYYVKLMRGHLETF